MIEKDFNNIKSFEWDSGNIIKNKEKHNLDFWLIEEIFFNEPLIVKDDKGHSINETRYFALGKTDENLKLFVVFTVRKDKIRIISARKMNKKERIYYEQVEKNS